MKEIKNYAALAFDFDGTLFDTHELNYKAYKLAYYDLGIEIDEIMFTKTKGLGVEHFNEVMGVSCDITKLKELKVRYYSNLVQFAEPNISLLNILKYTSLPTIIVTTAHYNNISPLLKKYELESYISAIVTHEDVGDRTKPDPLAYQIAAKKLNIRPDDILAFEDTRAGYVSARAAGLDCILIKEFSENNIIRDVSGGSEAKTVILWDEFYKCPIICKYAKGEAAVEVLKLQYDFLKEQNKPFVPIMNSYPWSSNYGRYFMPYIIGTSVYEYQNRIEILEKVIDTVASVSENKEVRLNEEDVRQDCYETYIKPGVDIYNDNTKEFRLYPFGSWRNIPEFVNNFYKSLCHGDTTFENILITRDQDIVLIDPTIKNTVRGRVHDFSKLMQSMMGYEFIRDGGNPEYDNYKIEKEIFKKCASKWLTEDEIKSLKFLVGCLFFRRLKHQVHQNPSLVKIYGDIAFRLMEDFENKNYSF